MDHYQTTIRGSGRTLPQADAFRRACSPAAEIYAQGQRDREQGWPAMAERWDITGEMVAVYLRGYNSPRTAR